MDYMLGLSYYNVYSNDVIVEYFFQILSGISNYLLLFNARLIFL